MSFTLAHLSDVHLAPLPSGAVWRNFAIKRFVGGISWHWRRKHLHRRDIADAIRADIISARPDHVALTGDLVNISAREEFVRASAWLREFGSAAWLSYTPGNHDAYVKVPWAGGLCHFAAHMTGEMQERQKPAADAATEFPFVRLRRNVAIVGLNSGCPQALHKAGGTLGDQQLQRLATVLERLGKRGFYRAVLIHHPPLPGQAPNRKALTDAGDLEQVLKRQGAELVLHGHNHMKMTKVLATQTGNALIIGVPSASMTDNDHYDRAAWNLCKIDRMRGRWQTNITARQWNTAERYFETASPTQFNH